MNAGFCPACGEPLEERHQGAWCRWHGKVLTCCEGAIDLSTDAEGSGSACRNTARRESR